MSGYLGIKPGRLRKLMAGEALIIPTHARRVRAFLDGKPMRDEVADRAELERRYQEHLAANALEKPTEPEMEPKGLYNYADDPQLTGHSTEESEADVEVGPASKAFAEADATLKLKGFDIEVGPSRIEQDLRTKVSALNYNVERHVGKLRTPDRCLPLPMFLVALFEALDTEVQEIRLYWTSIDHPVVFLKRCTCGGWAIYMSMSAFAWPAATKETDQ